MLQGLTGVHLVIILGIVLLLFGATKLPALAKGLGQSINIFKKEMDTDDRKKTGAAAQDATAYDANAPVHTTAAPRAAAVGAVPEQQRHAAAGREPRPLDAAER
ncbi:twin-arginine translocase TatA/TatE family subunit [Curtobacterium sp. MCPF17_052]|uniref:twin-arginine translocase TatA/TatE family subunit n=1 Tax=Curtobacterium sp. MCPF17_052 TaxID=2175655 RepID=UPI0024DF43C4|nr:twin-arginine translocase TatA/TatE family subunit [Curtobacterium sp. MCPF17_052]WIB11745.1 twin-arginine translocase TatA/TatE family subunit [Curtobacterium sp. MCPF17_052]